MRVAVKNMSGVFIHPTTPRKARLLLRDKKAVVESNNPFTIRLLFSVSECGLKDSKPLNKLNSGLLSEKDNTMCENEVKSKMNDKHETVSTNSIKWGSKTHLIYGRYGCGKTTMFNHLIQEKLNRDEDVFVFGTETYGRLYFNDKSNNKLHFYSPKDVSSFSSKVDPEDLAEYIVNFYYSVVGKDNTRTIAIDGFEQFELNPDYTTSEYFRELAKECRTNNINFLYVLCSNTQDKDETVYYKLPEIYERFSDIITVLK